MFKHTFFLGFALIFALLAVGTVAQAATIYSVTNTGLFIGYGGTMMAEGWSQTSDYTNVTVISTMYDYSLGGPISGTEGTVYLMNKIGPGTTIANQVASTTISGLTAGGLTATPVTYTLFSGLSLPAGSYYVVWVPTVAGINPSMAPVGRNGTPAFTHAAGVAGLGWATTSSPLAPFPPATAITLHGLSSSVPDGNLLLGVTGDPVSSAAAPTITTTAVSAVTMTTADSGGDVTSDGGASVTARGVCWSTTVNPTTANSCTSNGTGTGSFTSAITGLTAGTVYHVRAYATNSAGTAYGSDMQFTADPVAAGATPVPTMTEWGMIVFILCAGMGAAYYLVRRRTI